MSPKSLKEEPHGTVTLIFSEAVMFPGELGNRGAFGGSELQQASSPSRGKGLKCACCKECWNWWMLTPRQTRCLSCLKPVLSLLKVDFGKAKLHFEATVDSNLVIIHGPFQPGQIDKLQIGCKRCNFC